MTLRELYSEIGGDYDQAVRVLRMDRLIDKHIRRLTANTVFNDLASAGKTMEPQALFDAAHAVKGICANLGLTELSALASEITEEYRAGCQRKLTDGQVKEKIVRIGQLYGKTADIIRRYEQG